jgi:RNA polymerase sigma factor (sigma-70 family)
MSAPTIQLDRLYREHAPALTRYLSGRFSRFASPEDLLQETFLQAVRSANKGTARPLPSPRAWLFSIARHVGLTALRKSSAHPVAELPEPGVLPSKTTEPDDRTEAMRMAIARLPEAMRETLELRLQDELSYDEIASVLDVPVGTVRSRLHNAVRQLRDALKDQDL